MKFLLPVLTMLSHVLRAPTAACQALINDSAVNMEPKVIAWRHVFHQEPEPGNRETPVLTRPRNQYPNSLYR